MNHFSDEARILNNLEMSSLKGGYRESAFCGCACGGTQSLADGNADANHNKENPVKQY